MDLKYVFDWLQNKFKYSVPKDYLEFLKKGDFSTDYNHFYERFQQGDKTPAKNYYLIINDKGECEGAIDINEWVSAENLISAYQNGVDNDVEDYYLPIFLDSGASSVYLDCRENKPSFGNLVVSPSGLGYFDEESQRNVWEYDFVAISFSVFIDNLVTQDELLNDVRYKST